MRLSAKSLVAIVALALTASVAHAASYDIDFNSGVYTPLITGDNQPLNTYVQNGFTVAQGSTGQFVVNLYQGNPEPGITSGTVLTPQEPSSSIVLTDGGSGFYLDSFDADSYTGGITYSAVGTLAGQAVFNIVTTTPFDTTTAGCTLATKAGAPLLPPASRAIKSTRLC